MGIEEGTCWEEHWVLYGNQFDNKLHILKKKRFSFRKRLRGATFTLIPDLCSPCSHLPFISSSPLWCGRSVSILPSLSLPTLSPCRGALFSSSPWAPFVAPVFIYTVSLEVPQGQAGILVFFLSFSPPDSSFPLSSFPSFFPLHFYLFLREREREHKRGRGREREGDTESEAVSRLRAVRTEPRCGARTHKP